MNRIKSIGLSLVVISALGVGFSGCGGNNEGDSGKNSNFITNNTISILENDMLDTPFAITAIKENESIGVLTTVDKDVIGYSYTDDNKTGVVLMEENTDLVSTYIDENGYISFSYNNDTVDISYYDNTGNLIYEKNNIYFDIDSMNRTISRRSIVNDITGQSNAQLLHIGGRALGSISCIVGLAGVGSGIAAIPGTLLASIGCGATAGGIVNDMIDIAEDGILNMDSEDILISKVSSYTDTFSDSMKCTTSLTVNTTESILRHNIDANDWIKSIELCSGPAVTLAQYILKENLSDINEISQNLQGGLGNPRINLDWSGSADLDLFVIDSCNNYIFYDNPEASCNGYIGKLDVDANFEVFPENPQENITWNDGGFNGNYSVYIENQEDYSVDYKITIINNEEAIVKTGNISDYDYKYITSFVH